MTTPFTHDNIGEIFGSDAADTEDPARLYSAFVSNESYYAVRAKNPITLVVGQKGIGKTALMLVSAMDDKRDSFPNIFIRGSEILSRVSNKDGISASINQFRSSIEEALLSEVAGKLTKAASEHVGVPDGAGGLLARLAQLGSSIAFGSSEKARTAANKIAPWLLNNVPSINIYIDDTDVEWDGSKKNADKIAQLIQSCFQIAADSGGDVRFKISIRSDLFNYLSVTADIIDKVQSGVVRVRWTNDDIFRVVAKRIALYENRNIDDFIDSRNQEEIFREVFIPYFEPRFKAEGAWKNTSMRHVLMSFVRQRPRDLIGLCRLAAQEALKEDSLIGTGTLQAIIPDYCTKRLNDTVVEFRSEMPEVEKLLYEMRPDENKKSKRDDPSKKKKRNYYTNDELISKINNIKQRINVRFSYKSTTPTSPELAEFLFRINFLVASKVTESGAIERLYYDFADQKLREVRLGKWDWEVHMAYRWAIQHDSDAVWREI